MIWNIYFMISVVDKLIKIKIHTIHSLSYFKCIHETCNDPCPFKCNMVIECILTLVINT